MSCPLCLQLDPGLRVSLIDNSPQRKTTTSIDSAINVTPRGVFGGCWGWGWCYITREAVWIICNESSTSCHVTSRQWSADDVKWAGWEQHQHQDQHQDQHLSTALTGPVPTSSNLQLQIAPHRPWIPLSAHPLGLPCRAVSPSTSERLSFQRCLLSCVSHGVNLPL